MAPPNETPNMKPKDAHKQMRGQSGLVSFDDYLKPPGSPKKESDAKSGKKTVKTAGSGKSAK